MLFLKVARTRSPSTTVRRGPGHVPLKPSPAIGSFSASIWCWISSTVMSNTLTPSTIFGSGGTWPGSGKDAPAPPRNRSTTASALASWYIAGAEAAGEADGEWLIDGSAARPAGAPAGARAGGPVAGARARASAWRGGEGRPGGAAGGVRPRRLAAGDRGTRGAAGRNEPTARDA